MTAEIVRVPLSEVGGDIERCPTPDCPWPDDTAVHQPWCRAIEGHVCWGPATHQHRPKKGMGGNNPKSRIVAIICQGIHDAVDNGILFRGRYYRDEVRDGRYYIYSNDNGKVPRPLMVREIPEGANGHRVSVDSRGNGAHSGVPDRAVGRLSETDESSGKAGFRLSPVSPSGSATEIVHLDDEDLAENYRVCSGMGARFRLEAYRQVEAFRLKHAPVSGESWHAIAAEVFGAAAKTLDQQSRAWRAFEAAASDPDLLRLTEVLDAATYNVIARARQEHWKALTELAVDEATAFVGSRPLAVRVAAAGKEAGLLPEPKYEYVTKCCGEVYETAKEAVERRARA